MILFSQTLFKNVSFIKAAYWLEMIADLVQITKHVEFHLYPVWKPLFHFSVPGFHYLKPGIIKYVWLVWME